MKLSLCIFMIIHKHEHRMSVTTECKDNLLDLLHRSSYIGEKGFCVILAMLRQIHLDIFFSMAKLKVDFLVMQVTFAVETKYLKGKKTWKKRNDTLRDLFSVSHAVSRAALASVLVLFALWVFARQTTR